MKITILLSSYNGEKYLKEQLDSLFAQTYKNFQIIVRDDGSTDKTKYILNEYEKNYPNKVQIIEDGIGNLGSSKSFMKLLEYSSDCEYVMFCDQDDVWLPNKIELSFQKIKEMEEVHGTDTPLLVFTDLFVVDEKLKILNQSFWNYQKLIPSVAKYWKKLLAQSIITGCTIIMNKSAKEVCLPFTLEMMIHDQWIGVNVSKYGKIGYLNEQTILYRQHGNNVEGAHNYGIKYVLNKLMKLQNNFAYFKAASNHFKDITIFKLTVNKIFININRLIRK